MATKWLRELCAYDYYVGTMKNNMVKALAIFLYRCCGYTSPTEIIAGAGSFFSTEASGSNGVFTGTAKASGTISTIVSANHVNGEQMTLDDGWNPPTTFTFSNAPSALTDIDITGAVSADVMRDRIIAAINGIATLEIEATNGGAATVDLEHYRYGTRGNTTSSETVADVSFVLTNMTGGLDGWVLTDSVYGAFTTGNVGATVCVVDPTSAVNNGVYRVRRFISSTKIELDFAADLDNGEAFVAASGLTWYIWGTAYDIPATNGDLCRLASPHSSGWAIEFSRINWGGQESDSGVRIATDGNWGGSRILGTKHLATQYATSHIKVTLCVEVDLDGDYLNMWYTWNSGAPGTGNIESILAGVLVSTLETIEPDRATYEKTALFGMSTYLVVDRTQFARFNDSYFDRVLGCGFIIDEASGVPVQRYCFLVDPSYLGSTDGFVSWTNREANSRLASRTASQLLPWDVPKNDVWEGSLVIQDFNDESNVGSYEFIGWAKGHQVSRRLDYIPNESTYTTRRNNIQCSQDGGDRNRIYTAAGFIFTWPDGITFMWGT
jgi:hypothetical protein